MFPTNGLWNLQIWFEEVSISLDDALKSATNVNEAQFSLVFLAVRDIFSSVKFEMYI